MNNHNNEIKTAQTLFDKLSSKAFHLKASLNGFWNRYFIIQEITSYSNPDIEYINNDIAHHVQDYRKEIDILIGKKFYLNYVRLPILRNNHFISDQNGRIIALGMMDLMIKKFPTDVLSFPKLRFLDLSQNDLSEVPESIKKRKSIKIYLYPH